MDSIIRGANWYCGEINQRQRVDETTLPVLKREMIPMVMGGGWFGFELPAEIQPLTCEMSVNGVHSDLKTRFGREPGDWTTMAYYEALMNVFPASTGEITTSGAPQLKGRTVILKFASFEAARAFYDTPEYQKAKAAREGAAIMRMVCVEGV